MTSGGPLKSSIRRFLDANRGNVAVITAVFAPVAMLMAAMAIDTGAISTQRRALQGHADMAALAAASEISDAEDIARAVLRDNGRANIGTEREDEDEVRATDGTFIDVIRGRYTANREIAPHDRFVAGATPVNAVRVSLREAPRHYFGFLNNDAPTLGASGTAVVSAEAGISVGSRMARVDGGLLNSLLEELTGAEVSLSVMSYEALLETDIDMLNALEWLVEDLDLAALTYEDVLDSSIGVENFIEALAQGTDNVLARQALRALEPESGPDVPDLKIADLIDLGRTAPADLGHPPPGAELRVKAMPLLMAGLIVANGDRQIDLDLHTGLEDIYNVDVSLAVGERERGQTWFALSGLPGQPVSTAQLRLSVTVEVRGGALFPDTIIRLPLHIDLASAEARVTSIVCQSGEREAQRVRVAVQPAVARLRIAELSGTSAAGKPASLLQGGLIRARGYADVKAADRDPANLSFMRHEIGEEPKTTGTDRLLDGLLSSALSSLDLDIDVIGLSLHSDRLLTASLTGVVEELATPLDGLVTSLSESLGLGLGEADVWVHSAKCNAPLLVQ